MFSADIEVLAFVCTHLIRRLNLPWSGEVATLAAALKLDPRAALAGTVLLDKVFQALALPRHDPTAKQGWDLSRNGTLFIDSTSDTAVLTSVVTQSPDPLPAMTRLSSLGEAGVLRSLLHSTHRQIGGEAWIEAFRCLDPVFRRPLLLEVLRVYPARPRLRSSVQYELERLDRIDNQRDK
jgi:hypothetical protein